MFLKMLKVAFPEDYSGYLHSKSFCKVVTTLLNNAFFTDVT